METKIKIETKELRIEVEEQHEQFIVLNYICLY